MNVTDEVRAAFAGTPDPRLRELMDALVRHLHGFAVEVGLTREEWAAGIAALTAIGDITTETRSEFILLSDTLGLSSLVETLIGSENATEHTVLGPFYVPGSRERALGDSILEDEDPGEQVELRGRVLGPDGPVRASLDVWQNATNGLYAVQDPAQSEHNLRGRFTTGDDGRFSFRTVRPTAYTIPDDGPVGRMLEATGRQPWRPAHVHCIVSAPGCQTLTTHVFDAASDHLDSDAVFGVRDGLIVSFEDGRAEFDFQLDPVQ